jgi:S-adenosylmethionine synthetase
MQGLDKLQGNPNSPDNATGQNATQQLNPQAILQSEKLQEAMSPLLNSLQQNIDLKNEKDKKEVELLNQADPNVITNLAANVQHIVQENQQIKHTQAQQGVINQQIMDNLTQQSQSLQELIKLNQKPTPESNQTQP